MLTLLMWLILGALVGWVASLIAGTDGEQGAVGNIVVGIVGAFIGGALRALLTPAGFTAADLGVFSLASVLWALAGAVILLWAVGAYRKRNPRV